jgi:FAD:protein FMN transferase
MKPPKRFQKKVGFFWILLGVGLWTMPAEAQQRYQYTRPLMGSVFNLTFYAANDSLARVASDSVFARLNYLNTILSDYLDGSETNRLSATAGTGQWVHLSQVLYDVLEQSKKFSQQTNGAFDCTVGPVVQLWRRATRRGYFPEKAQINAAKRAVGHRFVKLDPVQKRAKLTRSHMRLDFGAIGKGYAADQALAVLRHFGIEQAFLDAGGDLAIGQAPPQQAGWRITVSNGTENDTTAQILLLKNCGVATSGATYRYLEHQGQRYSHIANPRTGVGLTHHLRTTVVAPNGTAADALATAFSVLGIKKSKKLSTRFPEIGIWLVESNHQKPNIWKSPRFDLLFSATME